MRRGTRGRIVQPVSGGKRRDEEPFWSCQSLARTKAVYENLGYQLSVIDSRPPMEQIKLAQPGRDEEVEVISEFIRNMGAVGILV